MTSIVPGNTVGKFQVIEGYLPISPNKCMSCGRFHGTFIDFGLNDDWYGAVYFCIDCVTDMASQLGYCSPADRDRFIKTTKTYAERIGQLEVELEKYKNALAALGSIGVPASIIDIGGNPIVVELSDEGKEQSKSDSKPTRGEKRFTKQNDVGRPSGVSNDDSLDEFINI